MPALSRASRRVRLLCISSVLHAQLSAPSISGAEAATPGCCATATSAPDFTPLGMLTGHLSVGITTV